MTVAVCLAVGLKTSDLRVRDIVEKVQRKSRRVCLGGRVGVGVGVGVAEDAQRSASPLLL